MLCFPGLTPVENVDQAMEPLTGLPAGEADETGLVPEGSINYLVATQLAELSALRQAFAAAARQGAGNDQINGQAVGNEEDKENDGNKA